MTESFCNRGMEIITDNGNLQVITQEINLKAVRPQAVFLNEDEETVVLKPSGTLKVYSGVRNTPYGLAKEETYQWKNSENYGFHWTIRLLKEIPGLTLQASFYNSSDKAVRLKEIAVLKTENNALVCKGDPSQWWLSTLQHEKRVGNLHEVLPTINEVTKSIWDGYGLPVPFELPQDEISNDGHWRVYYDFLTLFTEGGQKGMAIGAVGKPEAFIKYNCRVDEGKLRLDIISEMNDILVEPGQIRTSQEVLILTGPYHSSVETILRWVAATHGHRTHRGALLGWCSWYDLLADISSKSIIPLIETVKINQNQLPFQVIQIDDGYQKQVGDWSNNEKFPDGMKPIVDKIKQMGAMAGIWLAPLAVHKSLGWLENHPDWFQRNDKGKLVEEAYNWGPVSHYLDPTHPEVQQYLRTVIRNAYEDGFRYFKIDFNTLNPACCFYNPAKTRLQVYRELYQLYREEMGEDCYLLACSGFTRGVVGFADAARIGPDSAAVWNAAYNCTIFECIRSVCMNAISHRILFINDPDVTYTKQRNELSTEEWQTWHSFVGLLGGMTMVSEPFQNAVYMETAERLEILNPPCSEAAYSFQGGVGKNHQFGFVAHRPWGSFASILLSNLGDLPDQIKLENVGLESIGQQFHVWSFWDEKYLGISDGSFATEILKPHGSVLLRLTPFYKEDDLPAVIGSNLHISMGAAEIEDIHASDSIFKVILRPGGRTNGSLYIYSSRILVLGRTENCLVSEIKREADRIFKVTVENRDGQRPETIEFEREIT